MPKTPSHKLYKLIKSLNGSEKRYFKLYSNTKNEEKTSKYILLFDAMDLQETYDEEHLKKIIYEGKAIHSRKFSELKGYLYELLLKSLQSYDEKISVDYKLKGLLQSVRVLFKRSHYNECKELLQKAQSIAEKYEHFISLLEILRWEKKIAYAQIDVAFLDREMKRIDNEEKDALEKLQNLSALKNIFFRILIHIRKYTHARSEDRLEMLGEFIGQPLLETVDCAKSYQARLLYYRIYALYYSSICNWTEYYKTSRALLVMMDARPEMIKEYTSEYIAGLSNLSMSCGILERYDEVELYLEKIRVVKAVTYDDKLKIHTQYYQNKFSLCIATGAFKKGLKALEKHLEELSEFDTKSFERNVFYYNYFYIYFGVGNYDMALEYLNKWLSLPRAIEGQDLQNFARILNLIVHYELGNNLLLDSLIRSARRYQRKQNRLFEFESILLKFFKEISKNPTEKVEKAAFVQLREASLKLAETPLENVIFKSFNFIAWMDSKINNQPFSAVVKKHHLSRVGKKAGA